mmetsp:Transcript_107461/g.272670  ORF Transcript_107461/g.272670 Transcript_107461/m.272670 type:complete len:110 (+) Transcript_107461:586-915(+)
MAPTSPAHVAGVTGGSFGLSGSTSRPHGEGAGPGAPAGDAIGAGAGAACAAALSRDPDAARRPPKEVAPSPRRRAFARSMPRPKAAPCRRCVDADAAADASANAAERTP